MKKGTTVSKKTATASEDTVLSIAEMLSDKGINIEYVSKQEAEDAYNHGLEEETRKILNTTVVMNGRTGTVARHIAAGEIAMILDNPNPAMVGQLRKNIGDDVVKMEVGGMGIDQFFDIVKADEEDNVTDA